MFPRIILTAETAQPQLAELCQVIKVCMWRGWGGGEGVGGCTSAAPARQPLLSASHVPKLC